MQYAERFKIVAQERAKALKEIEERSTPQDDDATINRLASEDAPAEGGPEGGEADSTIGGHMGTAVAGSAAAPQPVIIEHCCWPKSTLGEIKANVGS